VIAAIHFSKGLKAKIQQLDSQGLPGMPWPSSNTPSVVLDLELGRNPPDRHSASVTNTTSAEAVAAR